MLRVHRMVTIASGTNVNESVDDLERLQLVLDRSAERAGLQLRRTFQLPEHALTASQLARYLGAEQQFALATVTARGEPRVAPVQVLLHRGRLYVPTSADAARVRHLEKRPAVSLTHWVSGVVAVIVHGRAAVLSAGGDEFTTLAALYQANWWQALQRSGNGAFVLIEPEVLYTWARDPEGF